MFFSGTNHPIALYWSSRNKFQKLLPYMQAFIEKCVSLRVTFTDCLAQVPVSQVCPEEVAHTSRNITNLLPFSTPEGSRCRLIPVLSGLQECNYVTLQYKQVMTRAQPPLVCVSAV